MYCRKITTYICVLMACTCLVYRANGASQRSQLEKDVREIAQEVCEDVGVIKKASSRKRKTPIIVLEESHVSVAGQIQHAIVMERLYQNYGVRNIALEGHMVDVKVDIDTGWFQDAAKKNEVSKAEVAVRLLKEGEISCAEFMALAHQDAVLHPIERKEEYLVMLDDEAGSQPFRYILKIAQLSLTQNHVPTLKRLQAEMESTSDQEKLAKIQEEYIDYIVSADSWAKAAMDRYTAIATSANVEEIKTLMIELRDRASDKHVQLTAEEEDAMARNIAFWDARGKADYTMTNYTCRLADKVNDVVIPMIIGAAHTQKVCSLLDEARRPYAAITPLAHQNQDKRGDLTTDMFHRKSKNKSVFVGGISEIIEDTYPTSELRKPGVVIEQEWFQAKAETYLFTDRIIKRVFDSTGGSRDDPPYGFSSDDLTGKWITVDPKEIEVVSDSDDSTKKAAVFPLTMRSSRGRRKIVWVKAGMTNRIAGQTPSSIQRENVEALLKDALTEVQSSSTEESTIVAEYKSGKVQISLDTVATYAAEKTTVLQTVLHEI